MGRRHLFHVPRFNKRPLNLCGQCGHTWYPRGHNVSPKCPQCGNSAGNTVSQGRAGLSGCGCVILVIVALIVWRASSSSSSDLPIGAGASASASAPLSSSEAHRDDATALLNRCGKPDRDFTKVEGGQSIRHLTYKSWNVELLYLRNAPAPSVLVGIFPANDDPTADSLPVAIANTRMPCAGGTIRLPEIGGQAKAPSAASSSMPTPKPSAAPMVLDLTPTGKPSGTGTTINLAH